MVMGLVSMMLAGALTTAPAALPAQAATATVVETRRIPNCTPIEHWLGLC